MYTIIYAYKEYKFISLIWISCVENCHVELDRSKNHTIYAFVRLRLENLFFNIELFNKII